MLWLALKRLSTLSPPESSLRTYSHVPQGDCSKINLKAGLISRPDGRALPARLYRSSSIDEALPSVRKLQNNTVQGLGVAPFQWFVVFSNRKAAQFYEGAKATKSMRMKKRRQ
jgi:hypothetical protein